MDYTEFLKSKEIRSVDCGFEAKTVNEKLFKWQSDIVRWALMKGRCAIFADCWLGKTPMQLQWAQEVSDHTGKPVLIVAPLAVAAQTKKEGAKFDIGVTICRGQQDVRPGVNITNYEMVGHFSPESFGGVVLDESSILKNSAGATRKLLTEMFSSVPYRLCCTATPSPNDYTELGTHSEFLGVMRQPEMLSTFFIHDGGDTSKWRLKGHAKDKYFAWVASWACCLTTPADLGYDGSDYLLPELRVHQAEVRCETMENGDGQAMLFSEASQTLNERREARRNSLAERVQAAADIANGTDDQVLVWCDLNAESVALTNAINGAVEVTGSQDSDTKEIGMMGFSDGTNRVLVSKPSVAWWGMNWQHCNKMIFVGLSDSFEAYYQAVRRCWRFGQKNPVDVWVIISDAEGCVKMNVERKQADAQRMTQELIKHTKNILSAEIGRTTRISESYITTERMEVPYWMKSA